MGTRVQGHDFRKSVRDLGGQSTVDLDVYLRKPILEVLYVPAGVWPNHAASIQLMVLKPDVTRQESQQLPELPVRHTAGSYTAILQRGTKQVHQSRSSQGKRLLVHNGA